MIEYIHKNKVIYRAEKIPVPNETEYVCIKNKMHIVRKVVHLVEKKIIQVHLV
jgi:hypothetical protein